MLKRSRPPARKEKAHSRVESAVCCWAGVGTQKNPQAQRLEGSFVGGDYMAFWRQQSPSTVQRTNTEWIR